MISMDRKVIIAIFVVAVLAVTVPLGVIKLMDDGDDTPPPTTSTYEYIDFYVYFEEGYRKNILPNESEPLTGQGKTMTEVMESAFSKSEKYELELTSTGAVKSINSVEAEAGMSWVIFQWTPKWTAVTPGVQADSSLIENTSYLVALVSYSTISGRVVYDVPDVDGPKSLATFCLFFHSLPGSLTNGVACEILPSQLGAGELGEQYREQIETGLWISGYGSTAAEALWDACVTYFGWEYAVNGDGVTYLAVPEDRTEGLSEKQKTGLLGGGYLANFIGLSDIQTKTGYVYWNQYSWSDIGYCWVFNGFGLDGYDPAVTKFFGLTYQPGTTSGSSNHPFVNIDPYDYLEA